MANTVVLVVLDSLRYDVFYDYLRSQDSPFLSHFQESAVEFNGATATAPWSLPSHASMFTGKYPREHGALRVDTRISNDTSTLIQRLNEQGYTTACFTSNEFVKAEYGFGGWDHQPDPYGRALFTDAHMPISAESGTRKVVDALMQIKQTDKSLKSFLNAVHGQARRAPALVDDGGKAMTKDACAWIRDRPDEEDIFLFCNYMETHVMHKKLSSLTHRLWNVRNRKRLTRLESKLRSKDLHPDRAILTKEDVRLFHQVVADELRYVDHLLARLYKELDDAGRTEECLFILCSDHGDGLGEYGFVYHDFGGLTEPIVRVPLLVSCPGVDQDTISSRVSLSWIYPTVLDFIDQSDGPVLTDTETHPKFVGTENTGHILDIINSPADVSEYYRKDRLAVYLTSKEDQKHVKIDDDYVVRSIETDGLFEKDIESGGEDVIKAFETEYEATPMEKFDLEKQTERRLRDLGYI